MKVYEPKKVPCSICTTNAGVMLPICIIEGERRMYPVCIECKDKVPYEIIPVRSVMDKGFYYTPEGWKEGTAVDESLDIINKPMLTRYGKKLQEKLRIKDVIDPSES